MKKLKKVWYKISQSDLYGRIIGTYREGFTGNCLSCGSDDLEQKTIKVKLKLKNGSIIERPPEPYELRFGEYGLLYALHVRPEYERCKKCGEEMFITMYRSPPIFTFGPQPEPTRYIERITKGRLMTYGEPFLFMSKDKFIGLDFIGEDYYKQFEQNSGDKK